MTMSLANRGAKTNQSGFSLVELMVALVLGLLLAAAVLQTFVGAKQIYEFQQEFSRIQENGRFAMEFLSRDIRGADYWGCLKGGGKVDSILNDAASNLVFAAGLAGFDDLAAASTGYNAFFGGAGNQPDAIILQGAREGGIRVASPAASPNSSQIKLAKLTHPKGKDIDKGDILLVSDCTRGVIFQVTNANAMNNTVSHNSGSVPGVSPGNNGIGIPGGLGVSFGTDAMLFSVEAIRYWIRIGVSGEPVLVRGSETDAWSTGGDELVEGVENLQLLYGEDTSGNGTPNYFVPAGSISDMAAVVSVQIHLAIRSLRDNMLDAPQSMEYYGGPKTANDRRIRKVFTSTIALRNRLN